MMRNEIERCIVVAAIEVVLLWRERAYVRV